MPRVCHLVYDLIRGGTEGQCAQTVIALAQAGGEHRVAIFHRRGYYLPAVEAACGHVYELPVRHFLRTKTLRAIHNFERFLRSNQIDILHTWDADAAIFGAPAAHFANIPFITSRRDLGEIYPPHKVLLLRQADRLARRIVTNAESIRQRLLVQGVPPEKVILIPNLLDLDVFDAAANQPFSEIKGLPNGRRTAVVGRLDPEKNIAALIEALPLVRREINDAILVIAGDGRERQTLETLARERGVAGAVCFLGDTPEIPALLRQCNNAALIPSCNEGQSNAILEYLAAGLPVLATDCGGNRELLEGNPSAILVPAAATTEEIAAAWIRLFELPPDSGIRARLADRHSPEAVLPLFQALYDGIPILRWQPC